MYIPKKYHCKTIILPLIAAISALLQNSAWAQSASLTVSTNSPRQVVLGLGGNFAKGNGIAGNGTMDAVGQYNFDRLKPNVVRVMIPLENWEPVNDDSDSAISTYSVSGSASGFQDYEFAPATSDAKRVNNNFKLTQQVAATGATVIASVWNAPNWMVTPATQTLTQGRVLDNTKIDEFVESITAYVKRAKSIYNINISAIGLNETLSGYKLLIPPDVYAQIIVKGNEKLKALGLNARFLVGDIATIGTSGTINGATYTSQSYLETILSNSAVNDDAIGFGVHSWDAKGTEATVIKAWQAFGSLSKSQRLPVYINELGFDGSAWLNPAQLSGFDWALKQAITYNWVLNHARANYASVWEYMNDYPLVKLDATGAVDYPYWSFHTIKQTVGFIKKGAEIVDSTSSDPDLLVLGARDVVGNTLTYQVINRATTTKAASMSGFPSVVYNVYRTRQDTDSALSEYVKNIGTATGSGGLVSYSFPARSVTTFVGKLASYQLELSATQDTYVRGDTYKNDIYGQSKSIAVKWDGTSVNHYTREGYIKFDVSSSPAVISKATLRLFTESCDQRRNSTKNTRVSVSLVPNNAWDEATLSWTNRLARSSPALGSNVVVPNSWYEVDVTQSVRDARVRGGQLSFHLGASGDTYCQFVSKEGALELRPQLIVR